MDTKVLEAFVTLYNRKSVRQAAEYLYMSPQGLSRLLMNLENELDTVLFSRTAKGLEPTAAGEYLYEQAGPLLQTHRQLAQNVQRIGGQGTVGYDVIALVTMFCSNIAQGGATFGVALKAKDQETRSEGIACGISAITAGVTEPALYGINLRFGKPLIGVVIASAISGLFCGLTNVRGYTMGGSPSFLSLITFIGGEGNPMRGVIFGAIGGVMSLVIAAGISFVLYKDPEKTPAPSEHSAVPAAPSAPAASGGTSETVVVSPIVGEAVALTSIRDAVFSTETLGKGVAIEPAVGEVRAPFDGEITTFFDTGHAFGLAADDGVELLVHMGMDTIKLGGKGFTPMAKEGDRVKKGQLLLKFDIDYIKSQGLPITTPVVVSNTDDYSAVTALATGKVDLNTRILKIER